MKFLPFEHIIYLTPLSYDEVMTKLRATITKEKFIGWRFFFSRPEKPYEGWVLGSTFSMQRIIFYRNSFLPRIEGSVHQRYGKVLIDVNFRINLFAKMFIIIWCGIMGLASLFTIMQMVRRSEMELAGFIPVLMGLFGYAIAFVGYAIESRRAKADLQKIFHAEVIAA